MIGTALVAPRFWLCEKTEGEEKGSWYRKVLQRRPDGSLLHIGTVGFWRGLFLVRVSKKRLAHSPLVANTLPSQEDTFWGALSHVVKDFALLG
jgi:hypothetical protein